MHAQDMVDRLKLGLDSVVFSRKMNKSPGVFKNINQSALLDLNSAWHTSYEPEGNGTLKQLDFKSIFKLCKLQTLIFPSLIIPVKCHTLSERIKNRCLQYQMV